MIKQNQGGKSVLGKRSRLLDIEAEICDHTYKIVKVLGQGTFGEAYRVKHIVSGVQYAAKIEKKSFDAKSFQFSNEAKTMNYLSSIK